MQATKICGVSQLVITQIGYSYVIEARFLMKYDKQICCANFSRKFAILLCITHANVSGVEWSEKEKKTRLKFYVTLDVSRHLLRAAMTPFIT